MKLVSWNVNGLRACFNKGFMDFFKSSNADFFCLQETKMQEEQLETRPEGYELYMNSAVKKGYSGTAIFVRNGIKPLSVSYGMGIEEYDNEGRIITLELPDFYLVNCYTPNSQRELARLTYRMGWEDCFRNFLKEKSKEKPVVLCGDLNVAHTEMDIKNAKSNRKNAGFTDEERAKMTELLEAGFTDSFRFLYPDKKDAYTWWSYMANVREKNIGWRIDYFVVSCEAKDRIEDALIYSEIYGSDHCPVGLVFK